MRDAKLVPIWLINTSYMLTLCLVYTYTLTWQATVSAVITIGKAIPVASIDCLFSLHGPIMVDCTVVYQLTHARSRLPHCCDVC